MGRCINSAGYYHLPKLTVDAVDTVLQRIQSVLKYGQSSLRNQANKRPYHDIIAPHLSSYSMRNSECFSSTNGDFVTIC